MQDILFLIGCIIIILIVLGCIVGYIALLIIYGDTPLAELPTWVAALLFK